MKLLLADDHPLFREGIKPLLRKLDAEVEVVEAQDYPSAFAAMQAAGEVDLALIDLYMPGMRGRAGIAQFRAAYPDVPLVSFRPRNSPMTSSTCSMPAPWATSPSPRRARSS